MENSFVVNSDTHFGRCLVRAVSLGQRMPRCLIDDGTAERHETNAHLWSVFVLCQLLTRRDLQCPRTQWFEHLKS
jgi:hypothetical protein